jgi:hypothetical protein
MKLKFILLILFLMNLDSQFLRRLYNKKRRDKY